MNAILPSWAPDVSRETLTQLERYVALLSKWNQRINLVGKSTETEIWQRHIADSLQLLPLLPPVDAMADLGSGAGLPGMVIAIARPEIQVTLIEQDQRKAAFLQECSAQLNLKNVTVLTQDIATVTQKFSLITARALASLTVLCAMAEPLLAPSPRYCLFPKGENFAIELDDAKKNWDLVYTVIPSKTNEQSSIISITELSGTPQKQAAL